MLYDMESMGVSGVDILAPVKSGYRAAVSAAKTVKKTAGKIVRAPGDIVEGVSKLITETGKGVSSTAKTIPVILIIAAAGVAGYLVFMGKAGKKVTPSIGEYYPELLGRCGQSGRRG